MKHAIYDISKGDTRKLHIYHNLLLDENIPYTFTELPKDFDYYKVLLSILKDDNISNKYSILPFFSDLIDTIKYRLRLTYSNDKMYQEIQNTIENVLEKNGVFEIPYKEAILNNLTTAIIEKVIETDVLILHYINKNSRASELNQNFWQEKYYNDNEKSLQRLLECGYIDYREDCFTSLNKLKVDELKNILQLEDLKTVGKKAELIERIINTASLSNYQEYIKKERVITAKGSEIVNSTDFVYLLHDYNIGYPCDVYNCYLSNKELNKVDLVIKFIESKCTFEKEIHEYSNHSFLYSQLAEILIKYNAKDKALYYLLKACFEYLSSYTLDYSTDTLKRFKEYVKRIDFYTNKMKILLEANFDLKNNLTAYYLELTNLYTLHYFTDEEIESLITAFALKNSYGVDSIINRIYKRNKEQGKIKNTGKELDREIELYRQHKEENLLLENENKIKKKGFFSSLIGFILKE